MASTPLSLTKKAYKKSFAKVSNFGKAYKNLSPEASG
jgi:hypothetical protein